MALVAGRTILRQPEIRELCIEVLQKKKKIHLYDELNQKQWELLLSIPKNKTSEYYKPHLEGH